MTRPTRLSTLARIARWALCAFVFVGVFAATRGPASPVVPADAGLKPLRASAPAEALPDPDGKKLYLTRCMSCHQMNGQGVAGTFPPLVDSDWVTGDKGRLVRVILHGLSGEIKVGDKTYNGAMPGWGTFMDDAEVAALSTYIRASWGNEASAVTPAEVAAVRAAHAERKQAWTAVEFGDEANLGIPGKKAAKSDEGR